MDPLLGWRKGGSRATRRRREEADVQKKLTAITAALATLQARVNGTDAGKTKGKAKEGALKEKEKGKNSKGDILIIARIKALLKIVDGGQKVTHAQAISKLQEVLREVGVETIQDSTNPGEARSMPKAPEGTRKRLWKESWGKSKIVAAPATQASLDETTEELVVFCQSANEFETADRERKARGRNNITFVVLDKNGEEEILIEGTKGTPETVKANIVKTGPEAPSRLALAASIQDDTCDDSGDGSGRSKLRSFRSTSVRGFTEESIFNRVENDPELLPGGVLGEQLAAKVVRTHGATSYGTEVTCVVSTSENNREFLAHQNLKTSRNDQQLNWPKAHREISVLGVD